MAEHLASIFGTEKDRVNCPFYFKIGCVCGMRGVLWRAWAPVCAAASAGCVVFLALPPLLALASTRAPPPPPTN